MVYRLMSWRLITSQAGAKSDIGLPLQGSIHKATRRIACGAWDSTGVQRGEWGEMLHALVETMTKRGMSCP